MTTTPFQNVAFAKYVSMTTGYAFVDVDVLAGATSTFGIDRTSVSAYVSNGSFQSGPAPRWNAQTGMLRIYRPTQYLVLPVSMEVTYSFRDVIGNESNTAKVSVNLTSLPIAWRGNPASIYCLKDAYNSNTGYKGYQFLELYYTGAGTTYVPLTTKANSQLDPDYVPPFVDTAACPLPSVAPILLKNQTPAGGTFDYINRVIWKKTGNPDIDFNFLAINPGGSQIVVVPTGIYTSLEVYIHRATGGTKYIDFTPGNVVSNVVTQVLTTSSAVPNTFASPTHAQPGSTIMIY